MPSGEAGVRWAGAVGCAGQPGREACCLGGSGVGGQDCESQPAREACCLESTIRQTQHLTSACAETPVMATVLLACVAPQCITGCLACRSCPLQLPGVRGRAALRLRGDAPGNRGGPLGCRGPPARPQCRRLRCRVHRWVSGVGESHRWGVGATVVLPRAQLGAGWVGWGRFNYAKLEARPPACLLLAALACLPPTPPHTHRGRRALHRGSGNGSSQPGSTEQQHPRGTAAPAGGAAGGRGGVPRPL